MKVVASVAETQAPKNVEPLVITTPESLPQVITYQTQNIQLEYSGGDGSEPFWMPCILIPSFKTDGLKVSSHGIIMGSIAGSEKSEDHICVTLWVGNQMTRKNFFYKIIPTTKATMSILSPEKLHTGTIGKKYIEVIQTTKEIDSYGNYYDAEGKRDCNRTASIEKVSGTLPPGLAIHNENDRPGG